MEKLELKAKEFSEKIDLRCKGWCHDVTEPVYIEIPKVEYFN